MKNLKAIFDLIVHSKIVSEPNSIGEILVRIDHRSYWVKLNEIKYGGSWIEVGEYSQCQVIPARPNKGKLCSCSSCF